MKAEANITYGMFIGSRPNSVEFTIIERDGTTAPLGDIRRFAVENKMEAIAKAKYLGIEIIKWN